MLDNIKKRNESGFTIIEVLIVLAIAGLILLVVFLAVPALQRNGRNTTVKNDASALAGGLTDFSSNNGGAAATMFTDANGTVTLKNASITTGATAKLQAQTSVNDSTTGATFASKTIPTAANVSAGALYVDSGESCPAGGGSTVVTKSTRAYAIYYWTETPGVAAGADTNTGIINGAGLKGQCLDT